MIVMYIDFRDHLFLEMTPQSVAAATAQMNPVNPNMTYNQFIGNNYNSHRAGYNDRKYYEQQARQWGK